MTFHDKIFFHAFPCFSVTVGTLKNTQFKVGSWQVAAFDGLCFVGQVCHRPLSRRLDRCDRVIHNESSDPNGGNMCRFQGRRVRRVYVTMQVTFLTRKSALIYRRGLRQRVASLTLNCNGDFAIRAYDELNGSVLSTTHTRLYVVDLTDASGTHHVEGCCETSLEDTSMPAVEAQCPNLYD